MNRIIGLGTFALIASLVTLPAICTAEERTAPQVTASQNSETTVNATPSKVRSAEDGWIDMSAFLDEAYGFVPIVMPITEPAVGYGAAAGLAFIDKPMGKAAAGFGNPNISIVGGMATENGTKGLFAADIRYWLDDRLQSKVGLFDASVNLDYYGAANRTNPIRYNLDVLGSMMNANYRLGSTNNWLGLGYSLSRTKVTFDTPQSSYVPSFDKESTVSGVKPSYSFDNRNTVFTPTAGSFFEATAGIFSKVIGSDFEYQTLDLTGIHYMPLHPKWTLGVRGDTSQSFGSMPFYMRPSVSLRGAPRMRYQGEYMAQVESELRWQCWNRFSVLGFVGTGTVWNNFERFDSTQNVVTGGTGFRYELARKYGLHMGVDVAFGPQTTAVYVQFGSAWMRM